MGENQQKHSENFLYILHLFNTYLWSFYDVLGTVLSWEKTASKAFQTHCLQAAYILLSWGRKQSNSKGRGGAPVGRSAVGRAGAREGLLLWIGDQGRPCSKVNIWPETCMRGGAKERHVSPGDHKDRGEAVLRDEHTWGLPEQQGGQCG